MPSAEKELDRVLTLLRNKIRERGFTQLEVQEALSWGRSYISQLLTKQKSLRVEQVLLILEVIGVDPGEFFAELYPTAIHLGSGDYSLSAMGRAPFNPSAIADGGAGGELRRSFEEVRDLVRGLVRVVVDKGLIGLDELTEAVNASKSNGPLEGLESPDRG